MRIQFVDALRGIAALAVVLHHYNDRLGWAPLSYGNLGVPVFFVLSGFVIAMSIGEDRITGSYLGRFVLRRSLRLDPPYWLTIAIVVGIGYAAEDHVKFEGVTAPQIAAHMFYLQDALAFPAILPVFWTLCYEIQFYLTLILLTLLTQALSRLPFVPVGLLLVASLLDRHFEFTHSAFMGRFWFCFALGTVVYWAFVDRIDRSWVIAAIGMVLIYGILQQDGYALTSSLTAAALSLALGMHRPDLLSGLGWQFLGRISYSVYLTHLIFGWFALRLAERVLPGVPAIAVGVVVAIASGWIFYVIAEWPAVLLSRAIRVSRRD
jgi:peptidoglycan/LPS O-acetylase OafA/YrhL